MTLSKSRRLALVAVVSACIGGVSAAGAQPAAAKVRTCPEIGNQGYPEKKHGGYITNIRATGVSCSSAKKLAIAYTKCRLKHGLKGKCTSSKVNGFKCTEKRPSSGDNGSDQFNASVTCKTGSKKVTFAYQQNY